MSDFELPANIKQIGTIGSGLKIFAEDYVCTYLKQFSESGGHSEKIALLVGKQMVIDSQLYIFISGAIQGKFSEYEDGMEVFTDKTFQYADEEIEKHFNSQEVLGWMLSQPGYGVSLNSGYMDYHSANFSKPYQVLYVVDPIEKLSAFYAWNTKTSAFEETPGYFVYYEQNKGMQNYMLDNKLIKAKNSSATFLRSASENEPDEVQEAPEGQTVKKSKSIAFTERQETPRNTKRARTEFTPVLSKTSAVKEGNDYKRIVNMLVTLSAVLVIICFIMGAGLIQSDSRISKLENGYTNLDSSYVYLSGQVKQINSQPVFANEQNSTVNSETGNAISNAEVNGLSLQPGNLASESTPILTFPTASATATPKPTLTATVTPKATAGATVNPTVKPSTKPTTIPSATPKPTPKPTQNSTSSPKPTQTGSAQAGTAIPENYTVKNGDSLFSISRKFYGSTSYASKIMELNQLAESDKILIGQVLKMPKK